MSASWEDDLDAEGVIEPARVFADQPALPERAVLCFFGEVVADLVPSLPGARPLGHLVSETGPNPVWQLDVGGVPVAVLQPGVGAPLAAYYLEVLVARGVRTAVACGGAGALLPDLVLGHAVVVDSARRDEGTSLHYHPPGPVLDLDPEPVAALVSTLERRGVPHVVGRAWTTDAIFRETRARVERRRREGCSVVEMECAALAAVARYRGAGFGQLLLAGDTLAGDEWDERGWMSAADARRRIFELALEAVAGL